MATELTDAAAARDKMDTDAGTAATGSGAAPAPASLPAGAPAPTRAPAPAAAPPPQPPQPVAVAGGGDEAKISQLMALGADRSTALQALNAANGQVEVAASLLFEM
jgi:DNA damage-inducible protein 1